MSDQNALIIYAVGDVGPNRENPESIFELSATTIRKADIAFCQLERIFSNRGAPQVQIRSHHSRVDPKNISALTFAGFNVISFASNHSLDWGPIAFLDSIDLLKSKGMNVIGVGKDIEEARKPVIIERKNTRVAFLGYCSILPKGYDAASGIPGCVPLRAKTFYEQVDWQAGTPPKILTFTLYEDLEAMLNDIKQTKALADILIVSIHWGVHFVPAMIADYQIEAAHAAIDAGADLILGHHAHILKGIEIYKNKVIFHGLCNFVTAVTHLTEDPSKKSQAWAKRRKELFGFEPDPRYPTYPFHPEAKNTIIAKCLIEGRKIIRVSYLPCLINRKSQPEILKRDKRGQQVFNYMRKITQEAGFHTKFTWKGNEVLIH